MNFSQNDLERIHRYTARRLVCGVDDLTYGKTRVLTATKPDDANFMLSTAFRKPETICVTQLPTATIIRSNSAPTSAVQCLLKHVGVAHPVDLPTAAKAAGVEIKADGGEPYFYLIAENFQPYEAGTIRQLSQADAPLLAKLHAAVPENMRWFVEIEHPIVFGCFDDDGALAAVASHFLFEDERIAAGGVLTHPSYRRRGYGRAVTSAAIQWALERGWICEWSTWDGNNGSHRIATSLGFTEFLVETDWVVG